MKGKIKLIGIGANNSLFEVKHFRDTYQIPFPLFADGDMAIYNALGGKLRTPYFIGLKIKDKGAHEVFFTQLGGFEKADAFYGELIGCARGRRSDCWIDFNWFNCMDD